MGAEASVPQKDLLASQIPLDAPSTSQNEAFQAPAQGVQESLQENPKEQPQAVDIKHLLGDDAKARKAFEPLWAKCGPANGIAPRMRVCEVLLQALREQYQHSDWYTQARRILAKEFGGSLLPVDSEEAYKLTRTAFAALRIQETHAKASSSAEPGLSAVPGLPGLGATAVDPDPLPSEDPSKQLSAPRLRSLRRSGIGETPPEPTRSDLESVYAASSAKARSARAAHEWLLVRMQEMYAKGQAVLELQRADEHERLAGRFRCLDVQQARLASKQEMLHKCGFWLQQDLLESGRRRQTAAALAEGRRAWAEEAQMARGRCHRKLGKHHAICSEIEEHSRELQAEQLRVAMLQMAVDGEQHALGQDMAQAEAQLWISEEDSYMACELELREEEFVCELAQEAMQLAAKHAADDRLAQAFCSQLRVEFADAEVQLGLAEAELAQKSGEEVTPPRQLNVEVVRRVAAAEMQAAQRRTRDAVVTVRRNVDNARAISAALMALQAQLHSVDAAIQMETAAVMVGKQRELKLEMRAEEDGMTEVQSLQMAIQELCKTSANEAFNKQRRSQDIANCFREQFANDLAAVRAELGAGHAAGACGGQSLPMTSFAEDLQAAALQRRLGNALAREMRSVCCCIEDVWQQPWEPHENVPVRPDVLMRFDTSMRCCEAIHTVQFQNSPGASAEGLDYQLADALERLEYELANTATVLQEQVIVHGL